MQKELNLTTDQAARIKEATDKAQAAMRELFVGTQEVGLSDEDRQTRLAEATKKAEARATETKMAIEAVLDPKQRERLKGIAVQVADVGALIDKEIQGDLKLSDDQVAKIAAANENLMTQAQQLMSERPDPQTVGSKMQELRSGYQKQLLDIMTADQKAALEKLKGARVEIPPGELMMGGPAAGPRPPATVGSGRTDIAACRLFFWGALLEERYDSRSSTTFDNNRDRGPVDLLGGNGAAALGRGRLW